MTFDFTAAANAAYAAGQTGISRAYVRAFNSGAYVPYYVDDAVFEFTILAIPEPAGLALLGLLGLGLLAHRRRRA